MAKVDSRLKRRYNLCYRARKKGYTIHTKYRTMMRGRVIDTNIEHKLSTYGFAVQLNLFKDE